MQVRSLSCVVVDLLVKECMRFTSSIAPRHWIVAFRKHAFPVFRSLRPDFVGEGLLLAFCLGSWGSRDGCGFFSANLRTESCLVESCLVPVSCRRIEAWKGVARPAAGIPVLEPSVGSRKTCGVGLCLVSFVRCGGVFSIISPLSLLSSYLVRLLALVLSVPFSSGAVFLRRGFSGSRNCDWGVDPTDCARLERPILVNGVECDRWRHCT